SRRCRWPGPAPRRTSRRRSADRRPRRRSDPPANAAAAGAGSAARSAAAPRGRDSCRQPPRARRSGRPPKRSLPPRSARAARRVPSAGIPRRRRARPAPAPGRRRPVPRATARGTREWSWGAGANARWSWCVPLEDGIDGIAGGAPGTGPGAEDIPPEGGDAVVTAWRPGVGGLDEAVEHPGRLEVAQHRVQRPLLAREHAVADLFQALGDLVAVHRLTGAGEHAQQRQRHGAAAQLLLELAQQRFDRVGAWVHAGHSSRNFDIVNVPVVMRSLESRQTALPEPPMRLAHALPLALAM